jgi:hypothetical protein
LLEYFLRMVALQRNRRVLASCFKSQFQSRTIQLDGGLAATGKHSKPRFRALARNISCVSLHCSCLTSSLLPIRQFQRGRMVPEPRVGLM